jgi:tetratricopeptide (TPR) repeat protein
MTAHADPNQPSADAVATPAPVDLHGRCAALKAQKKWHDLGALLAELPRPFDAPWVPAADEIAFALTQLGRFVEARDIFARIFEIEPTRRTASALAYVHYAALLCHKVRKPRLDEPEPWRKGFERWIGEALRLDPGSIVDRYRLGVYHASIQTRKDVLALKTFRDALRLFEALPAAERTEQDRLWKTYVKTLYAAARSAYRLGRFDEARRFIFRCFRLDGERNHIEPVFKLFLAAKVLVAEHKLDDAEGGLRLAIEAPHQGDRDFVYARLAEIALARDRTEDAAQWIEHNILPHHRKPYVCSPSRRSTSWRGWRDD